MTREQFVEAAREAVDSLPKEFRRRIHNVAVLVEDRPAEEILRRRPRSSPRQLLLGLFVGVPATQKSTFSIPSGPDHIILYQKNIEAVCRTEDEVREQIRRTIVHEFGHYFGMDEDQLKDV
jgi:predicted Zn-dependent protease with MMP-like domain